MNYSKILIGILFGMLGQIGTFFQLQVSYKMGWYKEHPWLVVLASVPLGWVYILSVRNFIDGFNYLSRVGYRDEPHKLCHSTHR